MQAFGQPHGIPTESSAARWQCASDKESFHDEQSPSHPRLYRPRQAGPSGGHRRRVHVPPGGGAAGHGPPCPGLRHDGERHGPPPPVLGHPRGHRPQRRKPGGLRSGGPHRCRPRQQPGDRRCRGPGYPRVRAGPGLGCHHAAVSQRAERGRYPRQNHHHLHVHPHLHGGGGGSHGDDRRHPAPAPRRLPGGPGGHHHPGVL